MVLACVCRPAFCTSEISSGWGVRLLGADSRGCTGVP
jgi:hypothetical protein